MADSTEKTTASPQHALMEGSVTESPYVTMMEEGQQQWEETASATDEIQQRRTVMEELVDLFCELLDFNRERNWKKKVMAVVMMVLSVLVIIDLLFLGNIVRWIHTYAEWMSLHIVSGTVLFILLLVFCTLIMIPPSILIFVCGYVYTDVSGPGMGIPAAISASFAGCTLGAILAFLRARYLMRDLISLFARRYMIIRAADRAIRHHGFRVFLLLRLCPVVPFNGLNYIGGITAVKMEDYIFSLVGMLPLIILTVVIGATAEYLEMMKNRDGVTHRQDVTRDVLVGAGIAFCVIAVCITIYFSKKELDRELQAEKEAELAAKAIGRNNNKHPESSSSSSSSSSQRSMTDEHYLVLEKQVEVEYQQGVNDEEWFWVYA